MDKAELYSWVLLPLLIYFSRMTDVTLGTLRIVLISKGKRKIVPFIGFFEVLLWLMAISQIMQNLSNFMCYFAWGAGYGSGIFLGLFVEEKLAIGRQVIRFITNLPTESFLNSLTEAHHGYTVIDGHGAKGPVKVIFAVVKRRSTKEVLNLAETHIPNSFYSIEDIKDTGQGVFSEEKSRTMEFAQALFPLRKGI